MNDKLTAAWAWVVAALIYGLGCERWELASRFNHEEDAE